MGNTNCCVDVSAVNESAYSTCASTSTSQLVVASSSNVEPVESKDHEILPAHELPTASDVPVVDTVHANEHMKERYSDSVVVKRKRIRRKQRDTTRTQSLEQVRPEPEIWLSDYLCPCDSCPHTQAADRLVETFYQNHPQDHGDGSGRMRTSLHRVLRGCATFDERRAIDLPLAEQAHHLLEIVHDDEDQIFRTLVKSHKQTILLDFPRALQSPTDSKISVLRRSSAITA